MSSYTKTADRWRQGEAVVIVDLRGMWIGLSVLNNFYFIIRIYEQIFWGVDRVDSLGGIS